MPDYAPELPRFGRRTTQGIRKKLQSIFADLARTLARRRLRQALLQESPSFRRLEPRRVLNASFMLDADALNLSSFDAGEDLDISFANNVSIDGGLVDAYIFDLSANTWETDPLLPADGIEVVGTELRVAQSLFNTPASTTLDIVVADSDNNSTNINVSTSIDTFGGDFRVTTLGNISSANGTSVVTTGDVEGEASGDFAITGATITLEGNVDTSGLDSLAAIPATPVASDAGDVTILGSDFVQVASIDASGGQTVGDTTAIGSGGEIVITGSDATANVTLTGSVTTTDAGNVIASSGNALTLNATASITAAGSGNVGLFAANDDLVIGGDINSGEGHLTLTAGDDVDLNASLTTSGTGTVFIRATNSGADTLFGVDMASTTSITTANANVRIVADNESDVQLGLIDAGTGDVSLIAERSILDGNGALMNVISDELRMVADAGVSNAANQAGSIGLADALNGSPAININAIDTQIATLAASSADGIYISETDGLSIGTTTPIVVSQVNPDTTSTPLAPDAALSGLTTTDDGPIKVVNLAGDITVSAAVDADGTGDVLLRADEDLIVNAAVSSDTGDISLVAGDDIAQNSTVTTGGGAIYVSAGNAAADGTAGLDGTPLNLSSGGGNIRVAVGNEGNISLGHINAGTGNVSLIAEGSILDGNAGAVNVTATNLRMVADSDADDAGMIGNHDNANGTPDLNINAIDTNVSVVAASSADGIYISEANGLEIGTVDVSVREVRFNSTDPAVSDGDLVGLTTTDDGAIKVVNLAGDITVSAAVDADGSGDVLLRAFADLIVNANISSDTGHITLTAGDDIDLNADVTTGGVGTIYMVASNATLADAFRGVNMSAATDVTTGGGNIRIIAGNESDIVLGHVNAGAGDVSLIAERSILDGNAGLTNVTATNLRMVADSDTDDVGMIGNHDNANGTPDLNINAIDTNVSVVAASSADGIYLSESDALLIGTTAPIAVARVNFNSTTTDLPADAALSGLTTTDDGPIKVVNLAGDITVSAAVDADGTGDVLLRADEDLIVNAAVSSDTGDISLVAGDDIAQNSTVTTGGGAIYVSAGNAAADGTAGLDGTPLNLSSGGGNIRVAVGNEGNISLGHINAGTGNVSLIAEGSILDGNAGAVNVTATNLRMVADSDADDAGMIGNHDNANGTPDLNINAIDTNVSVVAASSADGIYISEANGLEIGTVDVSVREVRFNSTDPAVSDGDLVGLTTTDDGPIKVVNLAGDITVSAAVDADGTGDVLLRADEDLIVNAAVSSDTGDISLVAGDDIAQNSTVTTGGGAIYVSAGNAAADGTAGLDGTPLNLSSGGGNIRVAVGNEGNISLGHINAGTGNVSLIAEGSILDGNAGAVNVTATNLRMVADSDADDAGMIGNHDNANGTPDLNINAIDTNVSVVAASSADGIYISEANGLEIGTVDVSVREVRFNSTDPAVSDGDLVGLTTTDDGPIKVANLAGDITVSAAVDADGSGDVLLRAFADLIVNANISSDTGHITLSAGDDIDLNADVTTGGVGTIYMVASNATLADAFRGVNMSAATDVTTGGGNIRIIAGNESDIVLGHVNAGAGDVSLIAERSILDGNAGLTNVTATNLRMVADSDTDDVGMIGNHDNANGTPDLNINAIDTNVSVVAASSADGIYLSESDALLIGTTAPIAVARVNFNSTTTDLPADAALSGLTTTDDGPIKVVNLAGDITVSAAVDADGTGDVLLRADEDLIVNAAVSSDTGDISLVAGDDIAQNSTVTTGGGAIYVSAGNAAADGTAGLDGTPLNLSSGGGNIRVAVGNEGNISLGHINAGTGNVSLIAEGSILDGNAGAVNVTATNLRMVADSDADDAGMIGNHDNANGTPDLNINAIDTNVSVVAASSADGIYISEANGLEIGTVDVSVREVRFNSTDPAVSDGDLVGLTTTDDGAIKVVNLAGDITVSAAVDADGSGDVLLRAFADLIVNANISSDTGHITLTAGDDIDLNADVTTGGVGTIYMVASNATLADAFRGVNMSAATDVTTGGGNIRIIAGNESDIVLGHVNAGAGDVSLIAERSILDGNAGLTNVTATNLRMVADSDTDDVGMIGNHDNANGTPNANINAIDTNVSVVAAISADGIYLSESDALLIGTTAPIAVARVNFNSTTTDLPADAALSGLTTTDNGPIKVVNLAGDITVSAAVDADGTGDVLLRADEDLIVNAAVSSDTGDISLVAGDDIAQNSTVTTGGGAIYVSAGNAAADGTAGLDGTPLNLSSGGGNIRVAVGNEGDIVLGHINAGAGNVSLIAEGSILDGNAGAVNVTATNLRMVADSDADDAGMIGNHDNANGTPDLNINAIDTNVSVVAASSADGIYISEANGLEIGTVDVSVREVRFNSTDPAVSDGDLVGLTTTDDGAIKVVNLAGDITVSAAVDADGSGDVLLRAFADLIVNANISSDTGHITLSAGDDIDLNADVTTGGVGTIYMVASNATLADAFRGVNMSAATDVTTGGGNIRIVAGNESDIVLGHINAGTGNVSLIAEGYILDGNAGAVNVTATNLRMVADSDADDVGVIGDAAALIDSTVDTVAARSADGIYINETDSIQVGSTGPITVSLVRFNSTTVDTTDLALSDLTTSDNGSIVFMSGGTMTLTDGADADTVAVQADGSGNIVLTTTQANADIVVDANVVSGAGDITADARHDTVLNALVQTSAVADTTIHLEAVDGAIRETDSAAVEGNKLSLSAAEYAHLHDVRVKQLVSAHVESNSSLAGFQTRNSAANAEGTEFVESLSNLSETQKETIREQHRFESQYGSNYALYLRNQGELEVATVTAGASGVTTSPNVYIETVDGNATLNVTGSIQTTSNSEDEGGIVLVAGGEFNLPGNLLTTSTLTMRNQEINTIGSPTGFVGANFFNGGEGIELDNPDLTTTEFVLRTTSIIDEDFRSHELQRVAMQFGFAGELGFEAIVAYADGLFQTFDVDGKEGVPGAKNGDVTAIAARPSTDATDAGIFTRDTRFDGDFLNANAVLPTNAVIRRATDFFIVENAGDPDNIRDLTVETQFISNVKSLGESGALPLPEDPASPKIAYYAPEPVYVVADPPSPAPAAEIELPVSLEQKIEVVIYQVDFEDGNMNGQVESFELPTFQDVIEFTESPEFDSVEDRVKTVDAAGGKEPTQADIDQAKAELQTDPDQPSGSYAIIKESSESGSVVLDVFGIRDWPEDPALRRQNDNNIEIVIPRLEPFDPETFEKQQDRSDDLPPPVDSTDTNDTTRWDAGSEQQDAIVGQGGGKMRIASAGLLAGSLMMHHRGSGRNNDTEETIASEIQQPSRFSRAARRRRALSRQA